MENQLTQTGLISALLSTMLFTMIFEIKDFKDEALLVCSLLVMLGMVSLLMSLISSSFFIMMINEFNSLDEYAFWIEDIGWRSTLPMRLFIFGMWASTFAIVSYYHYLFK